MSPSVPGAVKMSAIGRGRSRGQQISGGAATTTTAIKRPGKVDGMPEVIGTALPLPVPGGSRTNKSPVLANYRRPSPVDQLCSQIDNISLSEKLSQDVVERLLTSVRTACDSEKSLRNTVEEMYNKSILSGDFARRFASVSNSLASIEVDGVKFRTVLLDQLRNGYKNKDKVRENSKQQFLHSVILMCEVFYYLRLSQNEHIEALSFPVMEYLQILLTVDQSTKQIDVENARVFSEEMQLCGSLLKKFQPEKFEDLLMSLRSVVMSESSSGCPYLLYVLELVHLDWRPLSKKTTDFYATLGVKQRVIIPQLVVTKVVSGPQSPHDIKQKQVNVVKNSNNHQRSSQEETWD